MLSRHADEEDLVQKAASPGFDTSKLIYVEHKV
jgi:hypothetical protein